MQSTATGRTPAPATSLVRWWERNERKVIPYIFIAPFFVLFAVFMLWPVINSFQLSFYEVESATSKTFVGFENYRNLITEDTRFWRSIWNNTYFALGTVLLQVPLALILALALNSPRVFFRSSVRLAVFVPYITSAVVVSLMFVMVFDENYGLLNAGLGFFGIDPIPWLGSARWAMPSLILLGLWIWVGRNSLFFLAGLQSIPPDLEEAARIDGANEWQVFRNITLPLLRPVTLFVVIQGVIGSYQLFAQPYLLFQGTGGPKDSALTVVMYLYFNGFRSFRMGYASAIGYILVIIIFVASLIQLYLFRVWED
jgi:ABC-type sugar transport system permease subunit